MSKRIQSLERGVGILYLICESRKPMGLTEISCRSGLDKATTYRILTTLVATGLLRQDETSRSYRPGPGIARLHGVGGADLRALARPVMRQLVEKVGETACLILPRGTNRICVEVVEPDRELRVVAPIGTIKPLAIGSSGLVLLAWLPEQERSALLDRIEAEHRLELDRKDYAPRLARVAKEGWAYSAGEVEPGTSALAVPFRDALGRVMGALVVRAPRSRMPLRTARDILLGVKAAADEISRSLGHKGSAEGG